jgi:CRISPR-associated protein (TIGR03984 family)
MIDLNINKMETISWKQTLIDFVSFDDLLSKIKEIKNSLVIIYYINGIVFDYSEKIDKSMLNDKISEIRAFNELEELKATKVGDKYILRKIIDSVESTAEFNNVTVYDEQYKILGDPNKNEVIGDKVVLKESRGTYLEVPYVFKNENKNKLLFLRIRNYLNNSQWTTDSSFVDYRFVKIEEGGNNNGK